MPDVVLTKSAFKLAQSCPTKLYYYLKEYPCSQDEDEYLELLATGGFVIGELARLLYPEGILVDVRKGIENALEETRLLLTRDEVVIFEGTFLAGGKLVSTDILIKRGNQLELIEVKSKAFDSAKDRESKKSKGKGIFWGAKGALSSEWAEYIHDVAFQYLTIKEAASEFEITCALLMPDKAKASSIQSLWKQFDIAHQGPRKGEAKKSASVKFIGDAELIRKNNFLSTISVDEEVESVLPQVEDSARMLLASIKGGVKKIPTSLGRWCKECEFRTEAKRGVSGFHECWGELADISPHIFDLYFGTTIKDEKRFLIDDLIQEKRVSLYDVPLEKLSGQRGERQRIQIQNSLSQKEWISSELGAILKGFRYPLHFIDFETIRLALPWYEGMVPFEQIAFQWSCHTIEREGEAPVHTEWINEEDSFPNERFVASLLDQLGQEGTVFTWARHELNVLNDIAAKLEKEGRSESLLARIRQLTAGASLQGRLVDMNELTQKHYFHPSMKGRTSLKSVLPAIWRSNAEISQYPWLKDYVRREQGELLDPYKVLPPIEIEGIEQAVREGTGAMIAYENLIKSSDTAKKAWKDLLLQYCKLDTLAMVIVWSHWIQKTR